MNSKIGIHISYWQESWRDPLFPLIEKAHQAGFEVAEFPLLFPEELPYQRLRAELDRLEMTASCGTGLGSETDITHPDSRIREAGLDHLAACLKGAAQLGSPVLGGLTYAPWGIFPEGDLQERRENCIKSLQTAVQWAEELNVKLCLEVVNRFEGYLINTVQQGLDIIREVNSNYLFLHLDTFHLNLEADQIEQEIILAGKHLGHFHCVANNRKAPSQGHIPWEKIRQALEDVEYQGNLVAETFVNPRGEVGRGMFIWRSLADDLDQNARLTADFLRNTFQE
jgi:D-psicose/D-tagatose/L-ribulose 3-epimerase